MSSEDFFCICQWLLWLWVYKCSLSSPQPKIEWLKNQMVIGDDPKFRQIAHQGICSLEIRKPCSFDGGVYTCRAKNPQGEATVSCKLEVKRTYAQTTHAQSSVNTVKSVGVTTSTFCETLFLIKCQNLYQFKNIIKLYSIFLSQQRLFFQRLARRRGNKTNLNIQR